MFLDTYIIQLIPMFERRSFSTNFGEMIWKATDRLLRAGIRNLENVNSANEFLASGGNIILIHNHPGTADPLLILKFTDYFLANSITKGYFGSSKFFDGRMLDLGIMAYLQSERKTQFWQVLQPHDTKGLERLAKRNLKRHENVTAEMINASAVRNAVRLLKRNPGSVIMICPQGTREPVMVEPSTSIVDVLERYQSNTLVLPVQISGSEHILRKGEFIPHLHNRVTLTALPLLSYQQIIQRAQTLGINPAHAMMLDIAAHTYPKYWGVHREDIAKLYEATGIEDPIKALEVLDKRMIPV